MTKARDIADFKFENITDTGTEGTKVASGTTAQRGSTTGQWRYNTTTGFFEGRNASGDFSTLEPAPTVTSVDTTEVESDAGGNETFVITGTNFSSGGIIAFVGSSAQFNASTTTYNSSTQVTAVAPKASFLNAQEPYKIKFTSSSGLAGTSATGLINVDNAPTWTTSSGNIGSVEEGATANLSVSASDPDGDTISYSVQSGSLPSGLSLNSSTGAITGTAPSVSGDTTSTFDLRATAGSKTADRTFNIIISEFLLDGSTQQRACQYGSEVITAQGSNFSAGKYWLTGKSSLNQTAQQVYIDADGWMLVYRHAGTGGSYNSTYEIVGDNLGESAVGTLNSPTQGLTDSGSSTTAGSRGMARLSAEFCNALGGDSASGQVTRMTVGSRTDYITDAKIWWTASSADGYGVESISAGSSYSGRRTYSGTPETDRPICTYDMFNGGGIIPFYHGNTYSGGYNSSNSTWHLATTIWVRQY
tara:strand:- start:5173 stop:6594 length:1422 start_codon:yes stop_codon:yes gene_type:complete